MRIRIGVTAQQVLLLAACSTLLFGCVSRRLADRPIEGEPIRLVVRVAPDARVHADYSVRINPEDPVGSLLSVGTTIAKADQAIRVQQRMDAAMRTLDLPGIIEDGIGEFFSYEMDMPTVQSSREASYHAHVDVRRYGIDAGGPGSSVRFVLQGRVEMHDRYSGERIWRMSFNEEQRVSPSVFGLPQAAGNVLTAAMLAELSEEDIARGIDNIARSATWSVGEQFRRDLYRARRR